LIIFKSFLIFSLLTSYNPVGNQEFVPQPPKITSIDTDYTRNGIWVRLPKGTKKVTFHVKAENTDTVLFWIMPTGTQAWNLRKLIGYDIRVDSMDNQFSLTWNIDQPSLLDHLHIQALGEGIANKTINLIMD
jgi:hypothetical protein